ncbi:MAG: ABC transporter permease subunit [Bdellovibrionaceae bacterium]|nr:ABC transporter permease subunit [Pseudobdellovibrionaceae bacterium]
MLAFLFKRIFVVVPTLVGVSLVAFALIRLIPGDPVLLLIGERGASPEVYQEMKAAYGLDQPLPVQYGRFMLGAATGDLGKSIHSGRGVMEEFQDRFPATLELGLVALMFAILFGLPMGIIAAVKRNSIFDYSFMSVSLIGYSMPIFWWGLILILFFSVQLGWTPVSGRIDIAYDIPTWSGFLLVDVWRAGEGWPAFVSAFQHLILPAIALGTIPLAAIARMTRSSMLEVLGEDYMRTARAKGVSRLGVIVVHGLRNALVPVITVIGLLAGQIVTGAVLTETIFSWPGIGRWLVASVTARDYPVVQGGILLIASSVILINVGVDLAYAWANPKMRMQ